ncbi:MAG TPA: shikimate dehydrogenase [Bacteroidales bacterium]|nr:shikimate dehydrogenase [Bacteroidales bacterium]
MIIYGLIGNPLSHSGSGSWFAEKLRKEGKSGYRYLNFPLSSLDELPILLRKHPGLTGLNVTIPYKEQIIPWLEELDPKAEKIGAINTILIRREKGHIHLKGFNTDADGFLQSADFSGHRQALILGTGGAAKAVAFALAGKGISFLFVSRSKKSADHISYQDLSEEVFLSHTLIVNATPLGMFPSEDTFPPIPYRFLTENHFLYDLVYNPGMTIFLKKGSAAGATVQNGLRMLEIQAKLSYRIWNE